MSAAGLLERLRAELAASADAAFAVTVQRFFKEPVQISSNGGWTGS